EFIANSKVLEKGLDKKGYQYHLLKVIGEPRYRLANNFNFSSLKKRIIMMNKIRSARLHLVKFLFLLPLFAVLLVAFRSQQSFTVATPVQERQTAAILHAGTTLIHAHAPRTGDSRNSKSRFVAAAGTKGIRPTDTVPGAGHTGRDTAYLMIRMNLTAPDKGEPLYILDDKEVVEGIKGIRPDEISHISVLKDQSAVAKYGSKARNGVVLIYSKAYAGTHPEMGQGLTSVTITRDDKKDTLDDRSGGHINMTSESGVSIRLKDPFKGLVILDGQEISGAALSKLDPTTIGSMEVFKGEEATKKYGDRGKDGVILITSKK
ncbi:MAG TPA: hypothetical protein VE035_10335, partial [Puia sp.]|nr:hypothetical protein [Puia sp.]